MNKRIVDSWQRYKKVIGEHNGNVAMKYKSLRAGVEREHKALPWYKRIFDLSKPFKIVDLQMKEAQEYKEPTFEGYLNWEAERETYKVPPEVEEK